MLSTLGDRVELALRSLGLRLLQAISFVLWYFGWSLERAGPLIMSSSDKLKEYVQSEYDELTGKPTQKDSYKSKEREKVEAPLAEIAKPPKSEDHPDEGEPKIRINLLSTCPGIVSPELVTQGKPTPCEENSDDEKEPCTIGDLIKAQIEHDERHLESKGSSPAPAKQ